MPSPKERWLLAYLAAGYLVFAELLSLWASQWDSPCLVIRQYQNSDHHAGYETCAAFHEGILRGATFLWGFINHDNVTAAATVFIALFTLTLWRSTERMWRATKESADAAKLNAEALIDADRAHLYAVIKTHNLGAALRAANVSDMDDAMANPRPLIQFAIRNLGRAAAIMEETGWLLTQRELGNRIWDYPIGAIADPVVNGGTETTPATDCSLESVFRVCDAKDAFSGKRPLYFVGYILYTTSLDRVYEFRWQYENNGTGWLLTDYGERQRSHRPPRETATGTLSWRPNR